MIDQPTDLAAIAVDPDDNAPESASLISASDPSRPDTSGGQPLSGLSHRVIARSGLLVRSGPGIQYAAIRSLPLGTMVDVLKRVGDWGLIDQVGDQAADGFVNMAFLDDGPATPTVSGSGTSIDVLAGDEFVHIQKTLLQTIMDRCAGLKIRSKLDLDVVADALTRSMIKAKAINRRREVAFLSQAVIETDFFRTFEEYGKGANKPYGKYYGRGMHQLTWQATYSACSEALYSDDRLVQNPNLIISDNEVNVDATAWYWRDYKPFNSLADAKNIDEIIRKLYGGTIDSTNAAVRKSVILRRSYYKTIDGLIDQQSA